MSFNTQMSSDEDIESLPCNQVILPEWSDVGYAWKRGVHFECIDFWYKKVLSLVHEKQIMNQESGYVEGENSK